MKTLLQVLILTVCCIFLSCSNNDKPNSQITSQIATAYIVSDSNVTVASVGIKGVHRPVYPGGFYQVLVVGYENLDKSVASQASYSGIVKPGLDFRMFSGFWSNSTGEIIEKDDVMHNAIYIEKNGAINSVSNLYINHSGVTHYRIVDRILYVKKLTPVEADDLADSIKERIKKQEIFIY